MQSKLATSDALSVRFRKPRGWKELRLCALSYVKKDFLSLTLKYDISDSAQLCAVLRLEDRRTN
jgi:hypothetical protein